MQQPQATAQAGYNLPEPGNKTENARLSLQHQLWLTALGKLYISPVDGRVQRILDIGCGPGAWTYAVAAEFPDAQVVGLDLNPPASGDRVVSGIRFVQGNVEDEETLELLKDPGFDFVFMRCLVLGIHDWSKHLERCVSVLRSGGWLESCDIVLKIFPEDPSLNTSSVLEWGEKLHEGTYAQGKDPQIGAPNALSQTFEALGFADIHQREAKWYFGGTGQHEWASEKEKQFAALCTEDVLAFMAGATERVVAAAPGMDVEKAQRLFKAAKDELEAANCPRYHFRLSARCARKL